MTFVILSTTICQIAYTPGEIAISLRRENPYTLAGLGLLVAGCLTAAPAYFFFGSTWLTALGICMLILAAILIALGRAVPRLPPEVCSLLLETGIENIAALIEELGIKTRAIYLPSSRTCRYPRAFIPLHTNGSRPEITGTLPRRLIARYGPGPDDIGLLVSTIGSSAAGMLEMKPGATPEQLESALTSLLTGRLGIADGASVSSSNNHILVEINHPHLENGSAWSHRCLGGPLAALVASIAAEAWQKPVTISLDERVNGKHRVELEVCD